MDNEWSGARGVGRQAAMGVGRAHVPKEEFSAPLGREVSTQPANPGGLVETAERMKMETTALIESVGRFENLLHGAGLLRSVPPSEAEAVKPDQHIETRIAEVFESQTRRIAAAIVRLDSLRNRIDI